MIKRPILLVGFVFSFTIFLLMVLIIRQEKELIAAQYTVTTLLLWLGLSTGDKAK